MGRSSSASASASASVSERLSHQLRLEIKSPSASASASASDSERLSHQLRLEIKSPSFFRCPISLEVMRSPVSLCTGVSYDRSSIQRWLDSGNTTCPATMLPLLSTDLVPNLTLRRLINVWSAAAKRKDDFAPAELVKHIISSSQPLMHLQKLSAFFANPDVDDDVKNVAVNAGEFVKVVIGVLVNKDGGEQLMVVEAGIEVVSLILCSKWVEEGNKERLISALCADFDATLISLVAVLKYGSKLESRKNSAKILKEVLSASTEDKISMPEKFDALIPQLILLASSSSAVDEGLGCLIELLPSKRATKTMVQAKLVPALIRIISPESVTVSSSTAEKAVIVLEAAANCAAGRAAIGEMVEECVRGVMGRMLKFGKGGKEAAVGLLWCVCCSSGGDRRAKEAVAAVSGGTAKILVVMQGDCSPAVRRMAGDLLRVLRADAKGLLAGYDTKTTHIMPF